MSLYINLIDDTEIINSFNYARNSDIVFSEIVTKQQYSNLRSDDTEIIEETKNTIFYVLKKIHVKENDIIFTNTYFIELLLSKLKDLEFKNLKIITTQTDHSINKKLFKKKPKTVSNWYSTNVNYNNDNLHPIPLGLANNYSDKNLHKKDFETINFNQNKINKIYVNFEVNTNYFHRYKIKRNILKNSISKTPNKIITKHDYLLDLNNYKFILCPWGNGIDSHRIWESIFAGSIPLIPKHFSFEKIFNTNKNLFVNTKNLTEEYINKNFKNFKFNDELLTVAYWMKLIKKNDQKCSNSHSVLIKFPIMETKEIFLSIKRKEQKIKKFKTFLRKIHNKVINKKINYFKTYN
tara:strand:- start:33414 stop:34463 length:1050 start_codon:yes stop_codon:yes gene_type:complete